MTWLSILDPKGIMKQVVRDLAYPISPQGSGSNMECQVMDYLVHDTPWGLIWKARSRTTTWLSISDPKGIMNQVVRDLVFHINPQGYHEPNSP
jgi:hypothetical protein